MFFTVKLASIAVTVTLSFGIAFWKRQLLLRHPMCFWALLACNCWIKGWMSLHTTAAISSYVNTVDIITINNMLQKIIITELEDIFLSEIIVGLVWFRKKIFWRYNWFKIFRMQYDDVVMSLPYNFFGSIQIMLQKSICQQPTSFWSWWEPALKSNLTFMTSLLRQWEPAPKFTHKSWHLFHRTKTILSHKFHPTMFFIPAMPDSINGPSILDQAITSIQRKENAPLCKSGHTIHLPSNIFPSEDVRVPRKRTDPHVSIFQYILAEKSFQETETTRAAWNMYVNEIRNKVKKSIAPYIKDMTMNEVDNFFCSDWSDWKRKLSYFKISATING